MEQILTMMKMKIVRTKRSTTRAATGESETSPDTTELDSRGRNSGAER